jgi:AcrR family transcriptional regulator
VPVEQLRSQQRHERILDAAAEVFSTKGYHGTLVDEIAAEANTSKGGVYFHFPNKQAIFLALLDRLADILRERVESAVATHHDPIARAEAALEVVLQTFGSHRRLTRLFMVEALGAGPEFNARMIRIRARFADLIRVHLDAAVECGAIPALDTATAATAWFGAINEVVTQWALAEQPGRLEDVYPTIRAFLLRGIQAPSNLQSDDDHAG